LVEYQVEPPEPKLEHFHVVDDRIMMFDLESTEEVSKEDIEYMCTSTVEEVVNRYISYREDLEDYPPSRP
jgi:hypothetical protein